MNPKRFQNYNCDDIDQKKSSNKDEMKQEVHTSRVIEVCPKLRKMQKIEQGTILLYP